MRRLPLPAILRPAPLRRRLWQAGIGLLIFVGTMFVGNFFTTPDKALTRRQLGQDFIAFYLAGTFAREGHYQDLYNLDAARAFQQNVAKIADIDLNGAFGPYWTPPAYAWIFAPLSRLSFFHAVLVW